MIFLNTRILLTVCIALSTFILSPALESAPHSVADVDSQLLESFCKRANDGAFLAECTQAVKLAQTTAHTAAEFKSLCTVITERYEERLRNLCAARHTSPAYTDRILKAFDAVMKQLTKPLPEKNTPVPAATVAPKNDTTPQDASPEVAPRRFRLSMKTVGGVVLTAAGIYILTLLFLNRSKLFRQKVTTPTRPVPPQRRTDHPSARATGLISYAERNAVLTSLEISTELPTLPQYYRGFLDFSSRSREKEAAELNIAMERMQQLKMQTSAAFTNCESELERCQEDLPRALVADPNKQKELFAQRDNLTHKKIVLMEHLMKIDDHMKRIQDLREIRANTLHPIPQETPSISTQSTFPTSQETTPTLASAESVLAPAEHSLAPLNEEHAATTHTLAPATPASEQQPLLAPVDNILDSIAELNLPHIPELRVTSDEYKTTLMSWLFGESDKSKQERASRIAPQLTVLQGLEATYQAKLKELTQRYGAERRRLQEDTLRQHDLKSITYYLHETDKMNRIQAEVETRLLRIRNDIAVLEDQKRY